MSGAVPPPRRAAVLGSPIEHSLSPVLHRAAYVDLGLDWRYDAVEVHEAGLASFVAGCGPQWAGLSLTMPLKRAVLPLLDSRSALVDVVGAANTLVFERSGARAGHNTDVAGIVAALAGVGARPGPALVLGAGATAASTLAALRELGCPSVRVLARRPEVARGLLGGVADAVGIALTVAPWPDGTLPGADAAAVVVCTAPVDACAALAGLVPPAPGALLDVSYSPWPPPLVSAWRAAGGVASAGDEMLLHQAVAQVVLMTGRTPRITVMRQALRAAVRSR